MLISHKTDGAEQDVETIATTWHRCRDFLAIANFHLNNGGEVMFCTKQGGKPFFHSKKRKGVRPTQLLWHHKEPVIAVGWENGKVTLMNPTTKLEEDLSGCELDEVKDVAWNTDGTKLVAADQNGRVGMFKVDVANPGKSQFLLKTIIRDEVPRSIVCKSVKVKTTSGHSVTRKLAKQEPLGDADELLLTAIADSRRRSSIVASQDDNIYVRDNSDHCSMFYIGTSKGTIFSIDEEGIINKVYQCDNEVRLIVDPYETDLLLVCTDSMLFYHLSADSKRVSEVQRIKLSGKKNYFNLTLLDGHTVAVCYGEREIRIWDFKVNDNALFRLQAEKNFSNSDFVVCMAYSAKKNLISAGTAECKLARWKRRRDTKESTLDQQWRLQPAIDAGSTVVSLDYSPTTAALAVNSIKTVTIFKDEAIIVSFDSNPTSTYAGVQSNPDTLNVIRLVTPIESQEVRLNYVYKGFRVCGRFLAVWEETELHVYEIKDSENVPLTVNVTTEFSCTAKDILVYGSMIVALEDDRINVRTFQGTTRQTITFRESEGHPVLMDVNGKYMAIGSSNGFLSVFDLSGKEVKQQFHSSQYSNLVPNFEKFHSIRVNSAGNRISFTVTLKNDEISERLFVWDGETDSVGYFSFLHGITDQQQYETETEQAKLGERPKTASMRKIEREQSRYRLPDHIPGNHCWDKMDARYLVCEAVHSTGNQAQNLMLSIYFTTEHGVQMHDLQSKLDKTEQLLQLAVPYVYYFRNIESEDDDDPLTEKSISRLVLRKTLREFVGLDDKDTKAINAMLDFSFYLCMGQMDNAFKSIKYIKNESVWDHMARMCVKTRRMDVARVCLGNMRNARAARNLRLSIERGDSPDLQAAQLAIELGLVEEAKAIYHNIGRYDMLNKVLQTEDKWVEAFAVAEKLDRVNLRNTHYNYAKFLEMKGKLADAVENFTIAGTQKQELPRLLFSYPNLLERSVKQLRDPDLYKWWGRYLESKGDVVTARNFYKIAGDYLDVVRLLCQENLIDEAKSLVNETNNRVAALHLGRQFELNGDYDQAVAFYSKARAFGSAIRLAKENDMVDRLANLALQANGSDLVEAAKFYEDRPGHTDKAVMLYHKAGMVGKALDLAFRTEQHSALDLIVQELDEKSDPRVLQRAAEFFAANQQHRRAIQLLAYAGNFEEAIELCQSANVIITEELAEQLTPPKGDRTANEHRKWQLENIARCCLQQGSYHFAAKKFTQAGNKVEAMRALLKSGDTPKIVLFTNTAKNKEIYRMAANYLQTLSWHNDTALMRYIEVFYTKADALDSLASFYKSCADIEIDEYRDYDKALPTYDAAVESLNKKIAKDGSNDRRTLDLQEELKTNRTYVQRYIKAKDSYVTDPGGCLREITALLNEAGIDEAVRKGDLYAFLILHNSKRGNYTKAYDYIKEALSQRPRINIVRYVSHQILDEICDKSGNERVTASRQQAAFDDDDGEDNGVEYSHALRRRMSEESEEGMSDGEGF